MSRRLFNPVALTAGLFLVLGCGACSSREPAERPAAVALEVRVVKADRQSLLETFEAGGIVQARAMATLTSRIMATVREVRVTPGDRVRAGQTLVVLDDRDLSAEMRRARSGVEATEQGTLAAQSELEAAQAALSLAEATHRRIATLQERKSATLQELDEATASLGQARARVAGALARRAEIQAARSGASAAAEHATTLAGFASIVAPFDGIVTEKLTEPGNMAAPGTPLIRLDSLAGFRVEARIDESRAGWLAPGQVVQVVVNTPPKGETAIQGTITELARAIDADARAFLVKVAVEDAPGLRSGMFARARFAGPARTALMVPATAIIKRGQVDTLFVVENGVARLRLVRTAPAPDGRVEVLAGLDLGETVVVGPPPGLADERAVRPTTAGGGVTPPPPNQGEAR